MPQQNWQTVWADPDSFAFTLLAMYLDTYGTEGLSWDPSTIVLEIEDRWNVPLPRANFDKLLVGINLLTSNAFYTSLPTFIDFCNILNGEHFNPRMWNPAEAAEIAWGITEALLIDPPGDDDDEPFNAEILHYIGAALDAEGIITPPDILRIALRGHDPLPKIQGDFSDDPEMFATIFKIEASKTEDINIWIKQNLELLGKQVEALQLNLGDTKSVVQLFHNVRP